MIKWREIFQPITKRSNAEPKQLRNYFRKSIENSSIRYEVLIISMFDISRSGGGIGSEDIRKMAYFESSIDPSVTREGVCSARVSFQNFETLVRIKLII